MSETTLSEIENTAVEEIAYLVAVRMKNGEGVDTHVYPFLTENARESFINSVRESYNFLDCETAEVPRAQFDIDQSIEAWIDENDESLRPLFSDYCADSKTDETEENYFMFAHGMYFQCEH